MAEQWFYSSGGMKTGPISTEELRELVASGQLKTTDIVQRQGTQNWVVILSIDGLLAKPAPTPMAEEEEEIPQARPSPPGVKGAAIAVLIVAGTAMAITFLGLIAIAATGDTRTSEHLLVGLSFLHNCGTIFCALQMLLVRNHKLATVGSILVIGSWLWLTVSSMQICLTFFGLPCSIAVGVWSLMVLRKPEVKEAFAKQ